ncbi:hypothetical protein [Metabacillus fastidiosus]|uniref:hypothetical protein n=1 Tax=Metabacillus fastidiosus TaxID=1458 RepID=UPI003D2DE85B
MTKQIKKFEALPSVFKLVNMRGNSICLIEETLSSEIAKKYDIKILKNNERQKEELMEKMNKLLAEDNQVHLNKEFERLSNEMKELSEELVTIGTINCFILNNVIGVEVKTEAATKRFEYGENDLMEDLIEFLEKDMKKYALEVYKNREDN